MDKKLLFIPLALILIACSAFAVAPALTSNLPSTGQTVYAGNAFTLDFNMVDYNQVSALAKPQTVSIYYSTTAGSFQNLIVNDTNLQDASRITCIPDYNLYSQVKCNYSWTVPGVGSITNGTYYVDYNFGDFNGTLNGYNYRTSSSAAFTVFNAANQTGGFCSMMLLIPFMVLAGLVVSFVLFMRNGFDKDSMLKAVGVWIAVFVLIIVLYTLVGQVCV